MTTMTELDAILADDERIAECLVSQGSLCHAALRECQALRSQRDELVAACEELSEACEGLGEYIRTGVADNQQRCADKAIEKARAALAKAKGETR